MATSLTSINTSTTEQTTALKSDRAKVTPKLPHLWVTNIIAAQPLVALGTFAGVFSPETPPTDAVGQHILCLDPDTPELIWKAIAYELINQGCQVSVCQLGVTNYQPLEWYLTEATVPETAIHIVTQEIDWKDWAKGLDSPLDLEDALNLAKLAFSKIQGKERTIELDRLRRRCNVSSYDWNQYIRNLEAEIHSAVNRTGKSDRLKLEIQAWLRVTDPFEQELERIRILTHYQLKEKSFERMAQAMRLAENESANKSKPLSIGDLFSLESDPLRWLAPGFMPAKTSVLLSGLPGSGKSLLALDLAYAICRGEKFLGEQCAKGKVLYIASDQPLNQTKQYLWERGFEDSDPMTIVGEGQGMAAWSIRKLEDLESWLLLGGYTLVIVDSIRSTICYPLGLEEKSEHIGHWMKEAERLVIGHGSSLLWIHHDNKDKDLKGVSRSSGSTAIPANVSVHLRIENASGDETSPMRRLTMPKTRNFEAQSLEIQFKPETYEWEFIGRTGESPEVARDNLTLGQKIQALLQKHPGTGLEVSEIKQALGDSPSIYKVLSRLEAQGILGKRRSKTNPKAKVYFIADGSSDTTHLTGGGGVKPETEITDPPPPRLCPSDVEPTSAIKTEREIPSSDTHLTTPINPPKDDVKVGQWVRIHNRVTNTEELAQISELANEHGLYSYRQTTKDKEFTGALYRNQFELLSKNECLTLGLERNLRPAPYSAKNLPKKGDAIFQYCGKEKAGTIVRVANRKYFIRWEGQEQEMEHSLADLQTLDIRKES
jgi:DNA replication protein DnaC